MSLSILGDGFDIHGGGQDLVFPHHENERAQAVALGRPFARLWAHSGLVTVGGTKMSKSLGNFRTLGDLLVAYDPRAYRLLMLRSHYRSPLEVTESTLEDSTRALERLDALARRLGDVARAGAGFAPVPELHRASLGIELTATFRSHMDEDLDSPKALAVIFEAVRRANALIDDGDAAGGNLLGHRALDLLAALGLETAGLLVAPPEILELARRRDLARASRDFSLADALRAAIEATGWRVEDGPSGTLLRR